MDKSKLKQYRILRKEIEQLEAEKADYYHIPATKITDMPKAHKQKDLSDITPNLLFLQAKIDKKIKEYTVLRAEIEDSITCLQPVERVLMRLRYIDGKDWDEIAVALHYSYRHTVRLHGIILQKMAHNVTS